MASIFQHHAESTVELRDVAKRSWGTRTESVIHARGWQLSSVYQDLQQTEESITSGDVIHTDDAGWAACWR